MLTELVRPLVSKRQRLVCQSHVTVNRQVAALMQHHVTLLSIHSCSILYVSIIKQLNHSTLLNFRSILGQRPGDRGDMRDSRGAVAV